MVEIWCRTEGDVFVERGSPSISDQVSFGNHCTLCWRLVRIPTKEPCRKGYFCLDRMITQGRTSLLVVQRIGRKEEPHEDLALFGSTLILLLCPWAQHLWKGMLVTAQEGSALKFLIDQDAFHVQGIGDRELSKHSFSLQDLLFWGNRHVGQMDMLASFCNR